MLEQEHSELKYTEQDFLILLVLNIDLGLVAGLQATQNISVNAPKAQCCSVVLKCWQWLAQRQTSVNEGRQSN